MKNATALWSKHVRQSKHKNVSGSLPDIRAKIPWQVFDAFVPPKRVPNSRQSQETWLAAWARIASTLSLPQQRPHLGFCSASAQGIDGCGIIWMTKALGSETANDSWLFAKRRNEGRHDIHQSHIYGPHRLRPLPWNGCRHRCVCHVPKFKFKCSYFLNLLEDMWTVKVVKLNRIKPRLNLI